VVKIAAALRGQGHTVYTMTRPATFLADALQGQWNRLEQRPKLLYLLATARRIARFFDDKAIDIMHIHWGHDLPLASLVKRMCKRPVKLIYSRQMQITKSKRDPYHRLLYSQVDLFTAITRNLLEEARRYLPMRSSDLGLLRYGISATEASGDCGAFLAQSQFKTGLFTIGCLSRIEYAKGQHLLIEALRLLHSEGVQCQTLIVGHVMDSRYRESLQAKIEEYGLQTSVRFLEFIENPMRIMPCFDVIVLPTYEETFGLVLAEAMHMRVAVIGSRAGGVPEIVDQQSTGLMFEPGNHEDLAAALRRLHGDDELRMRLAEQGRASARQLYSDESHMRQLEHYFARLLNAPHRTTGGAHDNN
jgi:glycosyltransferase involved in cell wall biosynthesis